MSSGSSSRDPDGRRGGAGPLGELTGLDETARLRRLAFFELGSEDAAALRAYRDIAAGAVDDVVERFYEHLLRFPELDRLLHAEPGRMERLRGLQRAYFLELAEARFDADYAESRLRVGDAHQRAGIRPEWYIGAFCLYLRLALRNLVAHTGDGARILPTIEALVKSIFLDMSLAMDTYIFGGFVDRAAAEEVARARATAEEALRDRAEVARLRTDLTNMVVHDLKNPVNGIAMMVQLALRKTRDLPEAQRSHLLQIERTSREMMRLIQNLLEIDKIEEGKMPVAHEPIVLAELVDEVVAEYTPVAEQAGRRLVVAVDTGLAPALADRILLRRVLVNLIVNALRHSGSPTVGIEGAEGPGVAEVTLRVVDQGYGFPVEDQHRIFEKFRSVRRAPTGDPGDTGLGLPFCKLAVERMGGRITLTSVPGQETAFAVTLPIARA